MDLKSTKQLAALAALSDADRTRLERLAVMAKLSADELWLDVWRYGFDDVEEGILADMEADQYFKSNAGIDNAEVMADIKKVIAIHGKPRR
ncbi:hypothetical protein SAMN05428959_102673 [Duganella sp. CF517]|uniref:hypothetical protein n=1 Tax=Duganella sp. CF517 TaxID=1881038 RepID=UPI0008CD9C17|nr:hypothetical protein [Duganella sp. CF517]SEN62896.1 hypothetical protein SAMN05428959_102673 [Duganella sp. CF517]